MATERFIRGKVDDCNHDGRASNVRREQEADAKLQDYLSEVIMEPGFQYEPTNRTRHNENKSRLHGVFYHGTYYHYGVGQPHSTTGEKSPRQQRGAKT